MAFPMAQGGSTHVTLPAVEGKSKMVEASDSKYAALTVVWKFIFKEDKNMMTFGTFVYVKNMVVFFKEIKEEHFRIMVV